MMLQTLALDAHGLLKDMDPARVDLVGPDALQGRVETLARKLDSHLADVTPPDARSAAERLRDALMSQSVTSREDALRLRESAEPHYEALAVVLRRNGVRIDSLHPTNWRRTSFHVMAGVAVVAACNLLFTHTMAMVVAGSAAAFFWFLETMRRISPAWNRFLFTAFKGIAREHEFYKPNSSSWFVAGLLVISVVAFDAAGMLGILALAVGDPSAAAVGRRFGRHKLLRGRTLEGALGFMGATLLVGIPYMVFLGHGLGGPAGIIVLPLVCALAGAITEVLSTRVDDNFTVPVVAALTTELVARLMA